MKIETNYIEGNEEEKVILFVHAGSRLPETVEELLKDNDTSETIGYKSGEARLLKCDEVFCFTTEGAKVKAILENEELTVKSRLYQLEDRLGDCFVKINQSTLANIKKIKKFKASFSGGLEVVFKNGYKDYVSRRCLKSVKERIGL